MADSLIRGEARGGQRVELAGVPRGLRTGPLRPQALLARSESGRQAGLDRYAGADGSFLFSATKTQTQALSGGAYAWQIDAVEKATTDAVTLASGTLQVDTSLALQTAGGTDSRSHVKKMLDAVEAVLEGRASRVESEYQINGRMFKLLTPNELLELRGYYSNLYLKEQRANGTLQTSSQVEVVFREAR
jgi:hypothetical protein